MTEETWKGMPPPLLTSVLLITVLENLLASSEEKHNLSASSRFSLITLDIFGKIKKYLARFRITELAVFSFPRGTKFLF